MPLSETEPFDLTARSTVNSCWGALTMEVLARLGIQTVITSPGSRSTPLTVAAARNPRIEALSILDERSAAFYALASLRAQVAQLRWSVLLDQQRLITGPQLSRLRWVARPCFYSRQTDRQNYATAAQGKPSTSVNFMVITCDISLNCPCRKHRQTC
tara:strand:+ start:404 stop:874 length:471 start_codon:yes stop_codon:yes gene_type:complete